MEDETYQGWKYVVLHDECGRVDFKVPHSIEMKCDQFFKYYALSDNSVEALTGCYVYASHPNQFNDAFDCNSEILNFKTAKESDLQCLYGNLYPQFLDIYGGEEALKRVSSQHFKEVAYRHIGIVSLASQNNNVHLWHTYAQDSQGFCVNFDVKKFPFRYYGPHPIQYVENLSRFDVNGNLQKALFIQTNVKTKAWECEYEWRLLVSNPEGIDFNSWGEDGSFSQQYNSGDEHNRKMRYPLAAIKNVTLGERFFRGPDIKCYPITDEEFECILLDYDENLHRNVLDFLIDKPFDLFLMTNNMGELVPKPIEIVRLRERIYRIITKRDF